ncbi:uncharacterized protein LOC128559580 [Mercenaria mercenaria]|uniref:uncharacterized protein LOC128559580 n=1 Tax=Mercenaria mercenaria TaxID=6596 RepID=UPI00234F6A9C|nr:uncharacterized protein LOC128559580 [Mercenaria mercenaria]
MNPVENNKRMNTKLEYSEYVDLLNEKTEKRIERSKYLTYFMSKILGRSVIYSGSKSEGMQCAQSDTDLMFEAQGVQVNAISHETDLPDTTTHVFMDLTGVHPGYSKLVFRKDENAKDISEFAIYGSGLSSLCQPGSNFISNTLILDYLNSHVDRILPKHGQPNDTRFHGPCVLMSYAAMTIQSDVDATVSFKSEWPVIAEEWMSRERKYGWPAKELRAKIKSLGINFVPVGHASSSNKEIEWRLSFSKAERQLVWSFNPTQRICVRIMKVFFSNKITPRFPDLFPTYFIKTTMFWLLEETDGKVWKPENLLFCLNALLNRLIMSLDAKKMKNYFMPDDNMMDTKPTEKLDYLKHELETYRINGDDMWIKCFDMEISDFCRNDIYHHHVVINCLSFSRFLIYIDMKDTDLEICLQRVKNAEMILEGPNIFPDMCTLLVRELNIMGACLKFCKLCSIEKPKSKDTLETTETEIRSGLDLNLASGKLTLGTFLFCTKQYEETLKIVHEIEKSFTRQVIHYSFWERSKKPNDDDYDLSKPRCSLEETMRLYIALDVILLPSLIQMYPETIQTMLAEQNRVLFIHPLLYAKVLSFHCQLAFKNFEECRIAVNDMKTYAAANKEIKKTVSDLLPVYLAEQCLRLLGCETKLMNSSERENQAD